MTQTITEHTRAFERKACIVCEEHCISLNLKRCFWNASFVSLSFRWYAFPNFCLQISRPLAYGVRITSKASATAVFYVFYMFSFINKLNDSGWTLNQCLVSTYTTCPELGECGWILSNELAQLDLWGSSSRRLGVERKSNVKCPLGRHLPGHRFSTCAACRPHTRACSCFVAYWIIRLSECYTLTGSFRFHSWTHLVWVRD